MPTPGDLKAEQVLESVRRQTTVVAGLKAILTALRTARDAGLSEDKLNAVVDAVLADETALNDAMLENTPQEP